MDSRSENSTTNLNGSVDNGVDRNQEEQSAGADNDSGLEMRSGSETKWLCRPLEIVGLCIAVTLVWALFVLPFILFYFPKNVSFNKQRSVFILLNRIVCTWRVHHDQLVCNTYSNILTGLL